MIKDHILSVQKLRKREGREKTGCTIVEGYPEVRRAYFSKVPVEQFYVCPELIDLKPGEFSEWKATKVSKEDFAAMAFGKRLKGILAVCKPVRTPLDGVRLPARPLIIVLEQVEKPGNFGSVIRSADGAGAHLVVACDARTDIYNHHVVRSSTGTLFTVPTVACGKNELLEFLRKKKIPVVVATSRAEDLHYNYDMTGAMAVIVGNEHDGVSDFWLEHADAKIRIPMRGDAACLNVAHSASILMYEALRQRTLEVLSQNE